MNESWADTQVNIRLNNESLLYNGTYDTNNLVISTGTSPDLCSSVCSYTNTHTNTSSELKPLKFLPL